jgi:hypothetical protein
MGNIMSSAMRNVSIAFWEYPVLVVYILVVGLIFSRRKNLEIKRHPEYRFYLWGLYAKIMGGFAFTMIYMFYYKAGDVFSYFASAKVLADLARSEPLRYFDALFSTNTWPDYYRLFDSSTGYPVNYIFIDDRSWLLVKIVSPLAIVAFNSFLLTTALVSTLAYGGCWLLYRTLVRYYPAISGQLAFAVLFFPSSLFWGSGIVKDTFTFTGVCFFVHALDRIFFQKRGGFGAWGLAVLGSLIMLMLKPYVFMVLFPASLLWVMYHRVQRLRNAAVRLLLLPMSALLLFTLSFNVLARLEGRLGKFSLNRALETIIVAQNDMKRSTQYGTNYFDLGAIAPTWESVLGKFPQAVFAGLFRPMLIEVNNITMLLSALENTFLLGFMLLVLLRTRVVFFLSLFLKNPLLQMCYVFAIGYAFMIAVTTPNFGAMVRFKIPLLPLLVSALFITRFILDQRKAVRNAGRRFRFEDYADGDPRAHATHASPRPGAQRARGRPAMAAMGRGRVK